MKQEVIGKRIALVGVRAGRLLPLFTPKSGCKRVSIQAAASVFQN